MDYRVKILIASLLMGACSEVSLSPRGSNTTNDDIFFEDDQMVAKNAAGVFAQQLHPLLESNCNACHAGKIAPEFAVSDAEASLKTLIESKKINSTSPKKSRLVARLGTDRHNCWSDCDNDARQMLEAVEAWADAKNASETNSMLQTESLSLRDAVKKDRSPETVDIQAGKFEVIQGDVERSAVGIKETLVFSATEAKTVAAEFVIDEPGDYRIWLEVKSEAVPWTVQVDGNPEASLNTGASAELGFVPLMQQNAQAVFTLVSGQQRISISTVAENIELARLVATKVALPTPDDFIPTNFVPDEYYVFNYDVSEMSGVDDVEVSFQALRMDAEAFKISDLTLSTKNEAIKVESVELIVNGSLDERFATYRVVKASISPPGGSLSSAATTIILDDPQGEPDIGLGFKVLTKDSSAELFE